MLLVVLSVRQHVTDQNRLVIIEDLGYQPEIVSANVKDGVDPFLISFSHGDAIRMWVCLPDIFQTFPSGPFCDSVPTIQ